MLSLAQLYRGTTLSFKENGMKNAERDKLITQHYLAGRKVTDIAHLFGIGSARAVQRIARAQGAPARKNGRPRHVDG